MTTTSIWIEAAQVITQAQRIIVVTHVAPDGDAIGTLLGMTHILRAMGKQVDAAVDGGVPAYLKYIPASETVHAHLSEWAWDVCLSVDAADAARTGECGAYARAHSRVVINLDHHPTNPHFGDYNMVVPEAVSAAEVAFDWVTLGLQRPIHREAAVALLTGMVTDTLGFRTSNVKPRTLQIAQELMSAGASLTEITTRTLDTKSHASLLIWREALKTFKLEEGVIWAQVPFAAYAENHIDPATELNLSEFLVKIDEAMIAATFKQEREGHIRLSLRAKLGFNVSVVAQAFGGGGHVQASGATLIEMSLDEAVERVIPLLKEAVKNGEWIIR